MVLLDAHQFEKPPLRCRVPPRLIMEEGVQRVAAFQHLALHLALRILGVGAGDEVLVPTLTFVGGVGPVVQLGAVPVFVDSEAVSWNIDPALVAQEVAAAVRRGSAVSRATLWA